MAQTNEQLVVKIKSGDNAAIEMLWEQVKRLLFFHIGKIMVDQYKRERALAAGQTIEDLQQVAFFALLNAIETYGEDKEREYLFSTHVIYHLLNAVNTELGLRTAKTRGEPLSKCRSFSEAIAGEDGDLTLESTIADPDSDIPFEDVEHCQYCERLRADLESCLSRLPPLQATIIRKKHYECKSFAQISVELDGRSVSNLRSLELKTLHNLRHYAILQQYREDRANIMNRSHRRVGVKAFEGWEGSSVEIAVEKLARIDKYYSELQ